MSLEWPTVLVVPEPLPAAGVVSKATSTPAASGRAGPPTGAGQVQAGEGHRGWDGHELAVGGRQTRRPANRGGAVSLTAGSVTGNTAIAGGVYTDNGSVTGAIAGGGVYVNSGAVGRVVGSVSGNSPDDCAPAGRVPFCTG